MNNNKILLLSTYPIKNPKHGGQKRTSAIVEAYKKKFTSVKQQMTILLKSFTPDIIHIEQPFPYLGLQPLLEELNLKPKLVFGSQNIEAPMKREILESAGVPETEIKGAETLIKELEHSLSS